MTYNSQGKRITSENLAGQVTTTAWDQFACTPVGELIPAAKNAKSAEIAYDFDDIGNRETSFERGTNSVYAANQLNQYTEISSSALSASLREEFLPQLDDDGNQTLIQTATGIWSVTYNGENRPILWENISTNSPTPNSSTPPLISMSYDRMGRRVTKNAQRFVYDGYLQIANFEHSTSNIKLQTFIWDPSEKVATRPLVWNRGTSTAYYIHDGNKNVSEVVYENGEMSAHYEYAPFGMLTLSVGDCVSKNPWRFSSEYADDGTALAYFNYRHYLLRQGRWLSRDPSVDYDVDLVLFVRNFPIGNNDVLGLKPYSAWNTKGCSIKDINNVARIALKAAVTLMLNPLSFQKYGDVMDMVEFYGRICCDPRSKKVTYTGPISGDSGGKFAAIKSDGGGGWVPHSYPKSDPRVRCPKGTCVVAYYHTHPKTPNFSKSDITYIRDGVVAYYMSDGNVLKRLSPERTKDKSDLKGGGSVLPTGEYAVLPTKIVELGLTPTQM